jgi:hypothetical protein
MTPIEEALAGITAFFDELSIPYMLIGGLAMAAWGEPRATLDVDLSVWIEPDRQESTLKRLFGSFQALPRDPFRFASEARVCPLLSSNGVRIDVVLGVLPFERDAIARARTLAIGGRSVRVASVEDLLLMKLVSERPRDREDAERLLRRFGGTLDREYLMPLLENLADALGRPEIARLTGEPPRD